MHTCRTETDAGKKRSRDFSTTLVFSSLAFLFLASRCIQASPLLTLITTAYYGHQFGSKKIKERKKKTDQMAAYWACWFLNST